MQANTLLSLYALMCLVTLAHSTNWQASGTFTDSNLTDIQNTIQNNIPSFVTGDSNSNLMEFAVNLSNAFNSAWNPAWNVFVLQLLDPTVDVILFGYAFNNHWIWINGYQYSGKTFAFVIWKDYNCKNWNNVSNQMFQTSFSSKDSNYAIYNNVVKAILSLNGKFPTHPYSDVWRTNYLIVDQMQKTDSSKAYSVIAVQNGYSKTTDLVTSLNGRFCSAGGAESFLYFILLNLASAVGSGNHKLLLFNTRYS